MLFKNTHVSGDFKKKGWTYLQYISSPNLIEAALTSSEYFSNPVSIVKPKQGNLEFNTEACL